MRPAFRTSRSEGVRWAGATYRGGGPVVAVHEAVLAVEIIVLGKLWKHKHRVFRGQCVGYAGTAKGNSELETLGGTGATATGVDLGWSPRESPTATPWALAGSPADRPSPARTRQLLLILPQPSGRCPNFPASLRATSGSCGPWSSLHQSACLFIPVDAMGL